MQFDPEADMRAWRFEHDQMGACLAYNKQKVEDAEAAIAKHYKALYEALIEDEDY